MKKIAITILVVLVVAMFAGYMLNGQSWAGLTKAAVHLIITDPTQQGGLDTAIDAFFQ